VTSDQLELTLTRLIINEVEVASRRLTDRLLRHRKKLLYGRRSRLNGFEQGLYDRWYEGLDFYELALYLAQECGDLFNRRFSSIATKKQDHKFFSLIRLHGNASLIAGEILQLLKGGYSSGAHARWRSLHETAVIAMFIAEEAAETAERFRLHQVVKAYEDGLEQRKYASKLGSEAPTAEEWTKIENAYKAVINRYGEEFAGAYGWAKPALQRRNPTRKGSVKFGEIEKTVGVDFWIPYFRMASHAVHPSATSIVFNIGMSMKTPHPVIIAGPTNAGLADPGHGALLSLANATAALVPIGLELSADEMGEYGPTKDNNVGLPTNHANLELLALIRTLLEITDRAGDAFISIHRQLEAEEATKHQHT
jgi:hypothetical protein